MRYFPGHLGLLLWAGLLGLVISCGPGNEHVISKNSDIDFDLSKDHLEVDSETGGDISEIPDVWEVVQAETVQDLSETYIEDVISDSLELPDWSDVSGEVDLLPDEVEVVCTPDCVDKDCGEDGCNGTCGACDDGNPCTEDSCTSNGQCVTKLLPSDQLVVTDCICSSSVDCVPLNDTDFCNGMLMCAVDDDPPHCAVDPDSVVLCDNGKYCDGAETCVPATGTCVAGVDPHYDANDCTQDLCDEEFDTHSNPPIVDCIDEDPCTQDLCHPESGCYWLPQDCNDDDSCTIDTCVTDNTENYTCIQELVDCDDNDPCTIDSCDPVTGDCDNTPAPLSCDDGDMCTTGDTCIDGTCQPGPEVVCIDGDICTADLCLSDTGCYYPQESCDDTDACTIDFCQAGAGCQHASLDCDDQNPCTSDSCMPLSGCLYAPLDGLECSPDLDPCTNDICLSGVCSHPKDGWIHHPPYGCFKTLADYRRSWSAGTAACQDEGGEPASLYSAVHAQAIASLVAMQAVPDSFWTGLSDRTVEGGYTWINGGTAENYWLPGQPDATDPLTDCGLWLDISDSDEGLAMRNCHTTLAWMVCEKNPFGTMGGGFCDDGLDCTTDSVDVNGACQHPVSLDGVPCVSDGVPCTDDVCHSGICTHEAGDWEYYEPYGCFLRVHDQPRTWANARSDCISRGGDLASIYTSEHAGWLANGYDRYLSYWTGYNDQVEEGDLTFVHGGSKLENYDNFSDQYIWHEPPGKLNPKFDCVGLESFNFGEGYGWLGRLFTATCKSHKYGICEKNPVTSCGGTNCVDENPCTLDYCDADGVCQNSSDGWLYYPPYGCYRPHSEWLTWSAAEAVCADEGSHLATIYDLNHDSWFDNQFVLPLPCNEDYGCPAWVGLSDRGQEGTLRWSGLSGTGFRDWPSGGAKNSFADDCLAVHPDSQAHWQFVPCEETGFRTVCERNPPGTIGGGNCTDDNPCTLDVAQADGSCQSTAAPNGFPCPDDGNECSPDTCLDSLCDHPNALPSCELPVPQSCDPPCQDDDNPCTEVSCVAGECRQDADGYVQFPPYGCFKVHSDQARDWFAARDLCESEDGHLATLYNAEHMEQINDWLVFDHHLFINIWLDLQDTEHEGIFRWLRGNSTLTAWDDGAPNDGGLGQDCGALSPDKKNPAINDLSCSSAESLALCERNPPGTCGGTQCDDGNPCTVNSCLSSGACNEQALPDGLSCDSEAPCPFGCDDGNPCSTDSCSPDGQCLHDKDQWVWFEPYGCYLIIKSLNTWQEARSACQEQNGDLATIYTSYQATKMAAWVPGKAFWVGATDSRSEGHFEWVNGGTDYAYDSSDWFDGQPGPYTAESEDCAVVWSKDHGLLVDLRCDSHQRALCERNPEPSCGGTNCDEGDPCIIDYCDGDGQCQQLAALPGHPCVDDGNPCTADVCGALGGCHHVPLLDGSSCTPDGLPCSQDQCVAGICVHTGDDCCTGNCDDGNPCTEDSCLNGTCNNDDKGWSYLPGIGCFRFLSDPPVTWQDGQAACAALGGSLATLYDSMQRIWLFDRMLELRVSGSHWCGANDRAVEGQWEWSSGYAGGPVWGDFEEPDDPAGTEDCGLMQMLDGGFGLIDNPCHWLRLAICETNPEL
jgi:hypothetical protein